MQLDPSLYAHHLDGLDMSEADKLAFMQELWSVLSTFVDRAWGESSEQILLGIRRREQAKKLPFDSQEPLDSSDTIISTFNDAAGDDARESETP